jgi:hypothetical protein
MPSISKIPDDHIIGFEKILNLSENDFIILLKALENIDNVVFPNQLEKQLSLKLRNFSKIEIGIIVTPLIGLMMFKENNQISVDEVISDLIDIFKIKINDFDTDKEKIFKERVLKLLNSEVLLCSSKSIDLLNEFENFFSTARIVTDIRPIFGSSVENEPLSNIIIHNLHIHYHYGEEKECREIFLALDNKDIQLLKKAIIRAESKEDSIKKMLLKNNLKYLDTEDII